MIHPHLSGYSIPSKNTFAKKHPNPIPNPAPTIHGNNDAIKNSAVVIITHTVKKNPLKNVIVIP